jgi:hypothetical protein
MNEERIRRTNEARGSIYFQHTPAHKNIYEKVYTDDRDIVLFWKMHIGLRGLRRLLDSNRTNQ